MATIYRAVHYWLVDHPIITQYEWNPRQSPGASPLFLSITVTFYLSLTFLLHRYPILPTSPPPPSASPPSSTTPPSAFYPASWPWAVLSPCSTNAPGQPQLVDMLPRR
ncbi:UNVERIFIED_CONTAM: hypothetical protein Sangu_1931800 [Sesamum angustifolium]|uniref:Uncharacterized protein n=1 Tax=Sesamum angustifolium TaxID=2727405 RepID=A0AAW2LXB8_9LAMI